MDSIDLPIVEVIWRDAEESGEIGWNDLDEMKEYAAEACPLVKSVGYLLFESEAHISLLHAISSGGCSSVEKIPKGFIENLRRV